MNYFDIYNYNSKHNTLSHSSTLPYSVDRNTGDILCHYGIQGQKWGERRWQYPDGRFNEEGKERYFGSDSKNSKNNKKMLKTKTETQVKIGIPKFASYSKKVIKENQNKFTKRTQKEFDEAMSMWFDENQQDKLGVDPEYTKKYEYYFIARRNPGERKSKINKLYDMLYFGRSLGKHSKYLTKKVDEYHKANNIDWYRDRDNVRKAEVYGVLLDLGIKPTKTNLEKIYNYASTLS